MAQVKSDFDVVTKGFIKYLEKSGQLSRLPSLAREQIHASRTVFDSSLAVVETVVKLGSTEKKDLEDRLSEIMNKKIKVTNRVNPKILGGMLIKIGDRIVDLSFRSRIETVKDRLAA